MRLELGTRLDRYRPRRRLEDNIKLDLQEVGCWGTDWIDLAQDRDRWRVLVNVVMNLRVPKNAGNFLTSCKPVGFSRRTQVHGLRSYTVPHDATTLASTVRPSSACSQRVHLSNRKLEAHPEQGERCGPGGQVRVAWLVFCLSQSIYECTFPGFNL